MMTSLVERYSNGEHRAVWAELQSYGGKVRQEPLLSDALAVARETMRRARENLELLVPRLDVLGYRFTHPRYALVSPEPDTPFRLATLEKLAGVLPISIRAWCEVVGSANFTGTHPDWPEEDDLDTFRDPLVVEPLLEVFDEYVYWQYGVSEGLFEDEEARQFPMSISPDEFRKAQVSSGSTYKILIPNPSADTTVEGEWHETTFVNYLRACFKWGGFPGFARYSPEALPREALAYLTEGLLSL
jgi:hypothetical protein